MSDGLWKCFAVVCCSVAGGAAIGVALYVALLVNSSGGGLLAVVGFGLIAQTTVRWALAVGSWFWPEQCDPSWLSRNPPLFRFDRLRSQVRGNAPIRDSESDR